MIDLKNTGAAASTIDATAHAAIMATARIVTMGLHRVVMATLRVLVMAREATLGLTSNPCPPTIEYVRYASQLVRRPSVLIVFAATLASLTLLVGTTLASPAGNKLTTAREVNCGNVVGPRWTAKYGPTTGRHYTVTATNVSCATAISHFRRIVHRISPGPGTLGFWRPLSDVACLAPPKGKHFDIGGCTFGARPLPPAPGGAPPPGLAQAKSFTWHLCIATATKNLECTFTYLK